MNTFLAITLLFASANAQTLYDGSWTSIANMTIARSDFGSSALNDFIVSTGGCLGPQIRTGNACDSYSCSSLTDYVEAYFPANNSYVRLPNLPRLRFRHSSEVINGLLYVIGGRDGNDQLITQIDIYNPTNNSWSTSSYTLNGWCSDFSTFVKDSQIWMVGGYYQSYEVCSGVAYFDPKTGTNFTPLSSNMVDARGDTCSVYHNNSIYVIGGFDPNNNFTAPVATIEVYNFNTGKWSYGASLINPGGDKACGILNDRLRTFGGEGKKFNGTCYYSDPETDTEEFFFTTQSWSQEPPMDTARFRFAAEYFQNNKIYIFGGQGERDTVNDQYPTLNTAKVWADSSSAGTAASTTATASTGSAASLFASATVVMAASSFF